MKLPARRAHRRLWTVLVALAVATGLLATLGFWNPPEPAQEPPREVFYDQPPVPPAKGYEWADKWETAFRVNGFGTRYDAYQHARSWYDAPKTWVYASAKECKKNPKWKCYRRNMGGWTALVRPWSTTLDNMYAALGPRLRKYLNIPAWHTIPTQKLLIISTHSGKWVEVWIADYCACHGADRKQGTRDDSLIDLSPQVWAALGAYKGGKIPKWPYANTTPGFKNTIEIRFIP
jgi:hypothetical protein